jgi:MFS family permease
MVHHYESAASTPSAGELVSRISEQVSQLVRDELRLARTELKEKGKKAGLAGGLYGGAGLIALYGVAAFVAGAILGLAGPVPDWAAALIVGAVLFVVAGVAAALGRREAAQASPPLPREAVAGLKEDIQIVKDGVRR